MADAPLPTKLGTIAKPFSIGQFVAHPRFGIIVPVVHATPETIRCVFGKPCSGILIVDEGFRIGLPITIGIFGEPECSVFGNQCSIGYQGNSTGHHQTIQINIAGIHPAIAIGILQNRHPANLFLLARSIDVHHESAHFNYPQPTIFIEGNRNGIFDHRLSRYQLNIQSGFKLKRTEFFGGCFSW